jgi:hypothetical protein
MKRRLLYILTRKTVCGGAGPRSASVKFQFMLCNSVKNQSLKERALKNTTLDPQPTDLQH